jgi:hypothetical protein
MTSWHRTGCCDSILNFQLGKLNSARVGDHAAGLETVSWAAWLTHTWFCPQSVGSGGVDGERRRPGSGVCVAPLELSTVATASCVADGEVRLSSQRFPM